MSDQRGTCPNHGTQVLIISQGEADRRGIEMGCPEHNDEYRNRPHPSTMTPEDRADELRAICDERLWASMDLTWQRMDDLVGRPLMTHERVGVEYLVHEILTGLVPTTEGVLAKLPHDTEILVVDV